MRWLQAVESEFELSATTDFKPDEIRTKACEIENAAKQRLNEQGSKHKSLMGILLHLHDHTAEEPLRRRAINHLLVNNLQVSEEEQNLKKLSERLDKTRVEIERLKEQLQSRLPKGTDPNGQRYLQILSHITTLPELSDDSENLEAGLDSLTQQQQLPLFKELPYPIRFDSSSDLYWSVETQDRSNDSNPEQGIHQQESPNSKKHPKKPYHRPKERICVRFKGIQDNTFKIQCDRRQLPLFRQFLVDYQTYNNLPKEERFSEGLFALRSAHLIWRKDDSKHGSKKKSTTDKQQDSQDQLKPWNTHRLYLHCTVSRQLLTAEGTEKVREEKKKKVMETLKGKENLEKSELEELGLNKNQISSVKRQQSTLNRLKNSLSPPRPSIKPYEGHADRVIGVSFSRHEPVTIAVVDTEKEEVLEYQSAKELLNRGKGKYILRNGKKKLLITDGTEQQHPNGGKLYIRQGKRVRQKAYHLVQLLHQRHQRNSRRRTQEQIQDRYRSSESESNLALYVDRLIASRIVELALYRKAGTIAIPQLKGIREDVQSYIEAQAKRKFPNEKERQKEYAKHYRASFHGWSFRRLSECIKECASREGIAVVVRQQPYEGEMEQKAVVIALPSYKIKTS